MPDKLPKGWVKTTLGEIAWPSRSRALPMEVPAMRYVGLEHIEPQTMRLLGYGNANEVRSSSAQFLEGDVLYGKMRPYLNKVWVAEFDGICSAEFLVFPKQDGVNSQFLGLRLNGEDFVTFANGQVSGERPRVDFEALSRFPILLPPLAEQQRIIAKLNVVLTKLRRAEIAAHRAQERLKNYHSAVLHAAVAGELTHEWRKTHKPDETGPQFLRRLSESRRAHWEQVELQRLNKTGRAPKDDKWKSRYPEPTALDTDELTKIPHGWSWATLDQIAQEGRPIIYGIIKPGPHDPNGVPYVRVTEMKDGRIDVANLKKASSARAAKFTRATLAPGDVLISKDGTIGRVAVVPPELAGGNITQHVMRVPIHDLMSRDYVVWAIRSDWCQQWLTGETRGIALQGVNVADFRRLPVPIPPLSEQTEIAREVERRLSAAGRLAATLSRQIDQARITRQSLLREAFAGDLVPQDQNDKPASILLERIRADREIETKKPKGKRMSVSKSKGTRRPLLDVLREHKKPITPETLFRDSGFEAMFNESEEPQDVVDAFYKELRKLTDKPAKVSDQRDSRHEVTLKVLP